jgi:hypothetical protein
MIFLQIKVNSGQNQLRPPLVPGRRLLPLPGRRLLLRAGCLLASGRPPPLLAGRRAAASARWPLRRRICSPAAAPLAPAAPRR